MVLEGKSYLTAPIEWSRGEDPEYPYEAEHEGHKLLVRLNDFPEAELYALIADGEEITNFDDWPDSWTRPTVSETTYGSQLVVDETADESKMLSLTPREREVLRLIAQGQSTKQIAMALNIRVSTVEPHKAHILNILDRLRNLGKISLVPLEKQRRR
jgi:DNA-binding CsgD family transcriptional regulator